MFKLLTGIFVFQHTQHQFRFSGNGKCWCRNVNWYGDIVSTLVDYCRFLVFGKCSHLAIDAKHDNTLALADQFSFVDCSVGKSNQLNKLGSANLVLFERQGQSIYYSINTRVFNDAAQCIVGFFRQSRS